MCEICHGNLVSECFKDVQDKFGCEIVSNSSEMSG